MKPLKKHHNSTTRKTDTRRHTALETKQTEHTRTPISITTRTHTCTRVQARQIHTFI